CPLILSGAFNTSETNANTSVRPDASLWSSTNHWDQVIPFSYPTGWIGRALKGTGLAGSETYSSNGASPVVGSVRVNLRPAARYIGVGRTAQPASQPAGQVGKRRQTFVPVSKATTG